MVWLLDTGILLRYVLLRDPLSSLIRAAIRRLAAQGHNLAFADQSAAEFWNVCTRPVSARGGYGLSIPRTDSRLRLLERRFARLHQADAAYAIWRKLIVDHKISGVQVHDARLVAQMMAQGVTHILTLDPGDFRRFRGVTAVHPSKI